LFFFSVIFQNISRIEHVGVETERIQTEFTAAYPFNVFKVFGRK